MRIVAQIISYLFHPIFYPVYLLVYTLHLPVYAMQRYNGKFSWYLIIYVAISNVILPLIALWLMKRNKWIDSFEIKNAKQRYFPYLLMFSLYVFTAFSLNRLPAMHPILPLAFAASAASVAIITALNRFLKVSAHATAAGAATSWAFVLHHVFEVNTIFVTMVAVFVLGLVMSSRLILGAHTHKEVWLGAAIGISTPLIILLFPL